MPGKYFARVKLIMSKIECIFSPIFLSFLEYIQIDKWCINPGSNRFILLAMTFKAFFASTFKKEIGLQLLGRSVLDPFFNESNYGLLL